MERVNTSTQDGWLLSNYTSPQQAILLIGNVSHSITLNFITPTSAGMTINDVVLTLGSGDTVTLPDGFVVRLESISYLPVLHTITLSFYSLKPTIIEIPTSSTTTTVPVTTMEAANLTTSTSTPSSPLPLLIPIGVGVLGAVLVGYMVAASRARNGKREV